jgi:antitoxin component of RelBE/YafQ-DinJ toxin-antitoxin module
MATAQLKVNVDTSLIERLEPILRERGLTLDKAVGLYLRGMVNSSATARALRLKDTMPFGKYEGETVETILRVQPDYIQFIVALGKTRFDAEVFNLLEQLTAKKED